MSELLVWTSEDVALLRAFLETRCGEKIIPMLAQSAPTLFDGGEINRLLVRSGELRGYQSALREINFLAYPPPAPAKEPNAYPDLFSTSESDWPDTDKLK